MLCSVNFRAVVIVIAIPALLLASVGEAQTRRFTGQVFGYSPWEHLFKVSSFVENQEIVVFRLRNRPMFVKLVFASFGQEQLGEKYFDGRTTLALRAKRDASCDENAPQFFAPGEPLIPNGSVSGTQEPKELPLKRKYKVSASFAEDKVPVVDHLDCYAVESPRR